MSASDLTPEEWRRVTEILADVLEEPEESRAAFLDSACGGDEALRLRGIAAPCGATAADAP